ncbi:hypothetical protein A4A49_64841, partial [Nicotiana attenuata]
SADIEGEQEVFLVARMVTTVKNIRILSSDSNVRLMMRRTGKQQQFGVSSYLHSVSSRFLHTLFLPQNFQCCSSPLPISLFTLLSSPNSLFALIVQL